MMGISDLLAPLYYWAPHICLTRLYKATGHPIQNCCQCIYNCCPVGSIDDDMLPSYSIIHTNIHIHVSVASLEFRETERGPGLNEVDISPHTHITQFQT